MTEIDSSALREYSNQQVFREQLSNWRGTWCGITCLVGLKLIKPFNRPFAETIVLFLPTIMISLAIYARALGRYTGIPWAIVNEGVRGVRFIGPIVRIYALAFRSGRRRRRRRMRERRIL